MHKMWETYPQMNYELQEVQKLMKKNIHLKNKEVEQAILEMMSASGKMLRPAYQLLFANFGVKNSEKKRLALAAAVEMLHTATLIHDDIVDKSPTRRGKESIAHRFGNDVAVYAGDYLFVACFKLLSNFAGDTRSLQLNAASMEKILGGELGQMNMRYNVNQSVEDYVENISGKTAELFALSCFIGVYEAGATKMFSHKVYDIGRNIGIAFQIIDDLLDYTQTTGIIGKPVLEDIKQGVYSLPLLYALEERKEELSIILSKKSEMTDEDIHKVIEIMWKTSAIEKTKKQAKHYTDSALKAIQKLPNDKGNTREIIFDITNQLLNRQD